MDGVDNLTCEMATGDFYYDGFNNILELRDNKTFDTCYGVYILDPNVKISSYDNYSCDIINPNKNVIIHLKRKLKITLPKLELDRVKLFYAYLVINHITDEEAKSVLKRSKSTDYIRIINYIFNNLIFEENELNLVLIYFLENLESPYCSSPEDYNTIQRVLRLLNMEWCQYQLAAYDIIYPDDLFVSFMIFDGYSERLFGTGIEYDTIVGPTYDNQFDLINRLTIYGYNTCQTSYDE